MTIEEFVDHENILRNIQIQHYKNIQDIVSGFMEQKKEEYKKIQVISSPVEKAKELDGWQELIKGFYDFLNEFDKEFRKRFIEEVMLEFS